MAPIISILLTTYNRQDDCIRCLDKLQQQKTKHIEIILLDDYHLEDHVLHGYCTGKGIKYIHTGKQKNGKVHWRVPGFAYNIGARAATAEYLVIGGAEMYHMSNDTFLNMWDRLGASHPVVYDEPLRPGDYTTYDVLNGKLPFCFGLEKSVYDYIGGYDEDFTGYCFDDNDFSDRVEEVCGISEIDAEIVHLYNPRGAKNRGDKRINNDTWNYNRALYLSRKGIIIRNEDRSWGVL